MRHKFIIFIFIFIYTSYSCVFSQNNDYDSCNIQSQEQYLSEQIQKTRNLFTGLLQTIDKAPIKTLQYAKTLGLLQHKSDLYPVSPYSKIQHLCQSILAFKDYKKVHLPQNIMSSMLKILKSPEKDSDPTLPNIIKYLQTYISRENINKQKILFLLGEIKEAPQDLPLKINLLDTINSLFTPLFQIWKDRIVYQENIYDSQNIFSLLNQLEIIIKNPSLNEEKKFFLETPLGAIDNEDTQTLFGKAILAQKIVGSIITSFAPVHYPRLHHLLTHPSCSITQALIETIHYLKGESETKPHHTIANRLDALHNLWKKSLIEKLINCKNYWPKDIYFLSLQKKIVSIASQLSDLNLIYKDDNLNTLNSFFNNASYKNTYDYESLFTPITALANLLSNPRIIIDDEHFKDWVYFLGCAGDTLPQTLFGILNFISKKLENPSDNTWNETLSLIGKKEDLAEFNHPQKTFFGILNYLFTKSFSATNLSFQKIFELVDQLTHRIDMPKHLQEMLGSYHDKKNSNTLQERILYLQESIQFVLNQHQFEWIDYLIDNVYSHLPKLIGYLQKGLTMPSYDLFSHFGKAWWSCFEIYESVNAIINAAIGGGIQKIFHDTNSYLDQSSLQLQTLKWYLNQIHRHLQNPIFQNSQLRFMVGSPNKTHLDQVLTLYDRFQYIQEIADSIVIFIDLDIAQEWYNVLVSPQTGLLSKFHQFYLEIEKLSRKSNEKTLQNALKILGNTTDSPHQNTIFGIINFLFQKSSSSLFGLILNKYSAQKFNLEIQTRHLLLEDLQKLKEFFEKNKKIEMIDALSLIGGGWHNAFIPSVFGRLAACEDTLLQLWSQAYYIPIYNILSLAAQFYTLTHEIINEGWTIRTLKNIGTPISSVNEISLFGTLNDVISSCLTTPLGCNLKYITVLLPEIISKIQQHPALSQENKEKILKLIMAQDLPWKNSSEEKSQEINIESLQNLEQIIAESFYPIAGFFRFHQAQQLWKIGRKIITLFQEINQILDLTKKDFDPSYPQMNPNLPLTLLEKIGTPLDFKQTKNASIFLFSHQLGIRLHSMYSTLKKWVHTPEFLKYFQILDQLKQKKFPGKCQLYYLTNGFLKIDQSLNIITKALQSILKDTSVSVQTRSLEEKEFEIFCQKKYQLFNDIEESLKSISRTLISIAQVLPHVLGTQLNEILRCVDISEYMKDASDYFQRLQESIFKLVQHLGYALSEDLPSPSITEWNCSEFLQTIQHTGKILATLSKTIYDIAYNINRFTCFIPDLVETGYKIKKCELILQRIHSSTTDIQHILRHHANQERTFHCPSCNVVKTARFFENITQNLQEVSTNLSFLAQTFFLQAEIMPLQTMFLSLTTACVSKQGKPLIDQFYSVQYQNNGLPHLDSEGNISIDPSSFKSIIDNLQKTLQKIMQKTGPSFTYHSPACLAQQRSQSPI